MHGRPYISVACAHVDTGWEKSREKYYIRAGAVYQAAAAAAEAAAVSYRQKNQAIYNSDTGSLSQRFKSWAAPAPDSRPTLSSLTRTLTYPRVRRREEEGEKKK